MRPRGEVRLALGEAVWKVAREHTEGGTYRDIAPRACVGFAIAKRTLKDMVRAGELVITGTARVPGSARPANRYAPAPPQASATPPELNTVMCSWAAVR